MEQVLGPGAPVSRLETCPSAYTDERAVPLQGVSFDVAPSEFLAIVGPSGSGKKTVADLLMRFYSVGTGLVAINGIEMRDIPDHELRGVVGVVPQETFLLHASIQENLLIASPGAPDVELVAAMRSAGLHDFVSSLPDGYDTVTGDRGIRLSDGQRQRLAIARVLLQNPPLLILDEANSSLDGFNERRILAALDRASQGRTVIDIAHRLATIRDADRVLVLDAGRIVESGAVDELRQRDGLFRTMYQTQFKPSGV